MINIPDRILIAEDHGATRHFLQRIIESWGFEVIAVDDGEAALEILLSQNAPPLAIVDWIMPKFNGTEVCAAIRQRKVRPYTYIILLTALEKRKEITAGLEAGADDYVSKPFDGEELRARIRAGQRVVKLERTLHRRVEELQNALANVKKLKQLLPICMYCKNIRDAKDYWHQIEEYIHTETGAAFSHGVCPDCESKWKADLGIK